MSQKMKIYLWTGCAVLIGLMAFNLFSRPSTYEECILSEMKGQDSEMISIAGRVCRVRFPREHVTDPDPEILQQPNNGNPQDSN